MGHETRSGREQYSWFLRGEKGEKEERKEEVFGGVFVCMWRAMRKIKICIERKEVLQ